MSEPTREEILGIAAECAYRTILDAVTCGGYDARTRIGDFALTVAGVVKERISYLHVTDARLSQPVAGEAQWSPMDTAPTDGSEVLVWREDQGVFLAHFVLCDDGDSADWFTTYGDHLAGGLLPTHWMPVPAPPKAQPAAESAEPGPSDTLPRRVGYSTTTDARLIGSCADELEQLGQWVRAARDFNRDDAVDEIARAIENRVRALRAAMRKERP